jgi:hypothetical protein
MPNTVDEHASSGQAADAQMPQWHRQRERALE